MNNPNLRKRRPYGHEPAHELPGLPDFPVAEDPSSYYPAVAASVTAVPLDRYTPSEINILHQAATILNCSLSQLYDLDSRRTDLPHFPVGAHARTPVSSHSSYVPTKRPRLDTDLAAMPPPREKSPPVPVYQDVSSHQEQSLDSFPLTMDSTRFAQCLANFSVCPPCITCEPQGYASIPAGSSYSYNETLPYLDHKSNPPSASSMSSTLSQDQAGLFAANNAIAMRQMLPNYPVLQTDRPLTVQPTTSDQGMVYPGPVSVLNQGYSGLSGVPPSSLISPSNHPMQVPYFTSPSCDGIGGFGDQYTGSQPHAHAEVSKTQWSANPRGIDIIQAHQRPVPAKRGPFKSQDDREKTAETRRIGSCIRCRMQRIRCEANEADKTGACRTCQKVSNVKVWRMPCLRYKITDVKLFKPGQVKGHEWTRRWVEGVADEISHWASTETRRIKVTEGYTEHAVELRVREFVPQEGDLLERSWVYEGTRRRVLVPAYAIVNLEEAKGAYSDYISRNIPECCKSVLSGKDKLLVATYWAALKEARDPGCNEKEKELLRKALHLWMAVRLTTKSTVIVGEETLGMSADIMDETSPLRGKIPLPPVMGAQIELILIHQIQSSLRREMLESLQSMTQANKQQTWFTTYLITFILLHNVALLCQHDSAYARKHGMKTRFARENMVREYQMGANILLAYFHYCNKGIYPFSRECKEQDLVTLAGLDEQKTQFVRQTKWHVERHRRSWAKLRENHDYENDCYYISQLFEENWMPQPTI